VAASQVPITAVIVAVITSRRRRRRCRGLGGSVPGKKPNSEIGRDVAARRGFLWSFIYEHCADNNILQ
jgi:hypothetical protein